MKNGIDISELNSFIEKVENMGKKGIKVEKKALEESAKPILKDMILNCPDKTGKGKQYLTISKPKKSKGSFTVKIGVNKNDNSEGYYLKFFEYGTSPHSYVAGGYYKGAKINHPGQSARPFMRPALERNKKQAIEILTKLLKEGIENELK